MSEVIARTPRLILRTEKDGDQAVWLAHMNSPAVMACLGGPRSAQGIAESFARMARGWADHGFSFMMLERKADGMLIGHCGLSTIETAAAPALLPGAAQIGWTLREDAWGQGYAREAAQGVFALAFGRFGLERLYAQTSQSNVRSWRLMEKLGMTRRADLDYEDPDYPPEDNPTTIYELTRAAWRAREEELVP